MKEEGYYRPKIQFMMWGCTIWHCSGTISLIDGTLDSRVLLENNFWSEVAKHLPTGDYIFQDDGASIYTAHLIKD